MVKISSIRNYNINPCIQKTVNTCPARATNFDKNPTLSSVNSENLQAYIPSFSRLGKKKATKSNENATIEEQYKAIKSILNKETLSKLSSLDKKGILMDNRSNDGSTVLENLYKIATQPRIQGLDSSQILTEVINALDNPYTITQKFGDIPQQVATEISKETENPFPQEAQNVISSSCVVASMEFNLAMMQPAEFVRFAQGLSGNNYSVDKRVKMNAISDGTAECLWKLREFNTECYIENNWENAVIKIKPDRNAIVRARVQASYQDPGERSSVDVLIQSALLNLGSQHTYDALTDKRTGKFNPDDSGLTDFEKNFVEEVVFETPKISVVYQNIDENGHLTGYNSTLEETKNHILRSLQLGQNVIIGYTHMDNNKNIHGGHEITIIGYKQDGDKGHFICNDTDDGINTPIEIPEEQLLPLIHHAGISREALDKNDIISVPWKEILETLKTTVLS